MASLKLLYFFSCFSSYFSIETSIIMVTSIWASLWYVLFLLLLLLLFLRVFAMDCHTAIFYPHRLCVSLSPLSRPSEFEKPYSVAAARANDSHLIGVCWSNPCPGRVYIRDTIPSLRNPQVIVQCLLGPSVADCTS